MIGKNKIYLDYASSSPVDKRVVKLMNHVNEVFYANATSLHNGGIESRRIIEESRNLIAKEINAHNDEIIFTGSSTESNAIAILGVVNYYELKMKNEKREYKIPHIITSEIEHPAVLMNCKFLEERGMASVTYVKVNENGIVNPKDIKEAIKENTILVSIMYANNEIGTVQPIKEIAKEIKHYRNQMLDVSRRRTTSEEVKPEAQLEVQPHVVPEVVPLVVPVSSSIFPLFHTDATQAMNYLDTYNIEKLGVDMLSFNGSKIYGPKGLGILYKKRKVELSPIYSGGMQEFGLRSGTENTAAIAGLALSLEITNKMKTKEVERLTKLRDYTISKLLSINNKKFPIILNGDILRRLPNNINISINGISSELLVIELDAKDIEVSSRSACKSGDEDDSYVISALRKAKEEELNSEEGSLRITLGRQTKKNDIDKLTSTLSVILNKYSKWK